jgi:hypothetical protein
MSYQPPPPEFPQQQPQMPQYAPQQQPMYQQPPQGPQYDPRFAQPMQPSMPPQPLRKPRRWPWIIALIVVFFIGFGLGHIGTGGGTATVQNTTTAQTTATQASTAPAPQTSTGKWTTTHSYSGNGIKKTEVITVPNDWKIAWSCQGMNIGGTGADGILTVTVTNASDNTPLDVAVNATCKAGKTTSDITEEHQAGQVFLDINATGDWKINVQELK